jgi:hypothetical protein
LWGLQLVKPEEVCGCCNIFEDVDELEILSRCGVVAQFSVQQWEHNTVFACRSCDSSLFFLCRYEYTGTWHPVWMPYRNWPGCYEGCDDMRAPKQSDVRKVSCDNGQAKRCV